MDARVHGQTRGGVGRTALTYEIRPDAAYVAGIDLGGTQLRMAIANLASAVVAEASEATAPAGGHAVIEQIASVGGAHRPRSQDRPSSHPPCRGRNARCARCCDGFDQARAKHPRLRQDRCRRLAPGGPRRDVIVENDVNVGAIGERWLGRARGHRHLRLHRPRHRPRHGHRVGTARSFAARMAAPARSPTFPSAAIRSTRRTVSTARSRRPSVRPASSRRYVEAGGRPDVTVRDLFDRCSDDDRARQT